MICDGCFTGNISRPNVLKSQSIQIKYYNNNNCNNTLTSEAP